MHSVMQQNGAGYTDK